MIWAVRKIKDGAAHNAAALLEAARDSAVAESYNDVAADTLVESQDDEHAEAVIRGILGQIEFKRVEQEYKQLSSGRVLTEAERIRFPQVSQRYAELKGLGNVVPGR